MIVDSRVGAAVSETVADRNIGDSVTNGYDTVGERDFATAFGTVVSAAVVGNSTSETGSRASIIVGSDVSKRKPPARTSGRVWEEDEDGKFVNGQ